MRIERLLQINMATLATLATLLVGMGLRNPLMPLGMLVAAMLAVWLTDFTGRLALGPGLANFARIGALAVCLVALLREWRGLERYTLVMDVARLLVVLQVIALFQSKESRTYWHLAELSLLQVVVAGLLTQGATFGLILMVYLATGLSALALLFLWEERNRWQADGGPARSSPQTLVASSPQVPRVRPRWPLARQEAAFSSGGPGRLGADRELFGRLLKIALASLVLAAVTFFAVPRFGHGAWRGAGLSARASVGFSDKVRLGSLGRIFENPQEVLRIAFFKDGTSDRYPVQGEIFLRGAVLNHYENGQWSYRVPVGVWPSLRGPRTAPVPGADVARQRIQIEPMDRPELFCVWPFEIPDSQHARLSYDPSFRRLSRPDETRSARFECELRTFAFQRGEQVPVVPNDEGPMSGSELAELLQTPSLPQLNSLAWQWTTGGKEPIEDPYRMAVLLERKLRDSGRFLYSMKPQPRDPALDPIEDFVRTHPQGHCEYFATALAQMLRHVGIPARMVVGYKSGEWNDMGRYFTVRQLHAHTWVEAYLQPEQIPGYLKEAGPAERWNRGAWVRLDPTPAGEEPSGLRSLTTSKWFDWADYLWTSYVVDMDRPRQRQAIYEPVVGAFKEIAERLGDGGWWKRLFASIHETLGLERWFAIVCAALLAAALAAVLAYLGYRGTRSILQQWRDWTNHRNGPGRRRDRARVPFYRRLEAALARHGMVRPACQTPREFARTAGEKLALAASNPDLAALPAAVVEAYYRVRFGGQPLDNPQAEAVEHALMELERI